MKLETRKIRLSEGVFTSEFMFFDETDRPMLKKMFEDWVSLCKQSLEIGTTRIINYPEALSEAVFAMDFGIGRSTKNISGTSSSFDHYDFNRNKRIQLKAASSYGPSTFGPRSVYDELYFMFLRELADSKNKTDRDYSGKYEIYKIDPDILPSIICNKKKMETFADQQADGRRPRFSIPRQLIEPLELNPIHTGDILSW